MEKLKILRKQARKTQTQMAAFLGISQQAYAAYELGKSQPPQDILIKIADYYSISLDVLLDRNEKNASSEQKTRLHRLEGLALSLDEQALNSLIDYAEDLNNKKDRSL